MVRVLVLGGYGVFGARAAERLLRDTAIEVVIAGRDARKATALARQLAAKAPGRTHAVQLDAASLTAADLGTRGIGIVLNTVGPFQARDYRVARAAIAAGSHYIDLADARAFVTGIAALDAEARAANVLVVSGASSVPALAAAVIDALQPRLGNIEHLTYGISPGNSFDPGEATVYSILSSVGRPFTTLRDGSMQIAYGWQPLTTHATPHTGTRLLGACDIPDLDLFPQRYPSLRSQRFLAGVEVKAFHLGLWALSWLVRAGLLRGVERLTKPLLAAKRRLHALGGDRGLMFVELAGRDRSGNATALTWTLVAFEGHGPYIPSSPAVVLARALAHGRQPHRGALACLGLVTLADIEHELSDLSIRQSLS